MCEYVFVCECVCVRVCVCVCKVCTCFVEFKCISCSAVGEYHNENGNRGHGKRLAKRMSSSAMIVIEV